MRLRTAVDTTQPLHIRIHQAKLASLDALDMIFRTMQSDPILGTDMTQGEWDTLRSLLRKEDGNSPKYLQVPKLWEMS